MSKVFLTWTSFNERFVKINCWYNNGELRGHIRWLEAAKIMAINVKQWWKSALKAVPFSLCVHIVEAYKWVFSSNANCFEFWAKSRCDFLILRKFSIFFDFGSFEIFLEYVWKKKLKTKNTATIIWNHWSKRYWWNLFSKKKRKKIRPKYFFRKIEFKVLQTFLFFLMHQYIMYYPQHREFE